MASIKLAGSTSGEITISAPAVAGTNTLTLPANTGTVITSATAAADVPSPTQLSTASGSAPSYSARAWVNFNGTGTPSIRASGNVSSITDNGTGNYTVNFTTAMPDTDYSISTCPVIYTGDTKIREIVLDNAISSASNVTVECGFESAADAWTLADEPYLFLQVFR